MPAELIALLTAAMLGFLHALEVDHMMAVTTFVSRRPTLAAAAGFGFRWGLGHSLAVLAAGGLLLATGARWPTHYDAIAEAGVGAMLAGLGAWTVLSARKLHLHTAEEHGGRAHVHSHALGGTPHDHRHGAITLVGLLHGLAGTTGVIALLPVTLMDRVGLGLGYLSMFGAGVTVAMTLFALVAAVAVRRANARSLVLGRRMIIFIGCGGIAVGCWWMWRALGA